MFRPPPHVPSFPGPAAPHLSVGLGRTLGLAALVRRRGLTPRHLEGDQVLHDGVESLPLVCKGKGGDHGSGEAEGKAF